MSKKLMLSGTKLANKFVASCEAYTNQFLAGPCPEWAFNPLIDCLEAAVKSLSRIAISNYSTENDAMTLTDLAKRLMCIAIENQAARNKAIASYEYPADLAIDEEAE
jgi:hypothetical protein